MLNAIAPGRENAINPNTTPSTPRATTHPHRDARPVSAFSINMTDLLSVRHQS